MAEEQVWELWYPDAGATGLPFARSRIDAATVVWVHAAPPGLAVRVRQGDRVIARGTVTREGPRTPMTRLALDGAGVTREDRWPGEADIGATVLLPGGEAGILTAWWNAADESEWRWSVEFSNHV
jgi:hypothetical protein